MKKTTKQVVKYKAALRSARAIQNDKALQSETAETFLSKIGPYLTKKGEVRKNLSAKRQKEFNTLVSEYKHSAYATKKQRADARKKQTRTGIERGTWADRRERLKIVNAFKNDAISTAIKEGYLDSWQVVALRKTFDKATPRKLAEALQKAKDKRRAMTPSEAQQYRAINDSDQITLSEMEDILENEMGLERGYDNIPFD